VPFYPEFATGLVLLGRGADSAIGGTCFHYRARHLFITAAHCVPEDAEVAVYQRLNGIVRPVVEIARDPSHDIAVLRTQQHEDDPKLEAQMLTGVSSEHIMGGDFLTHGFPIEGANEPVPRLLKGHFQRIFTYTNTDGHEYFAAELSVPTPAGHSGGPVVWSHSPRELVAVVTTNHDSYILLDQIEEIEEDGRILRVESRRIVTYGIAVMVSGIKEWIEQHTEPEA
jgi:hypothetical protein